MLPVIAGVIGMVAVGTYLYNEASSSNASARREYDDACDDAREWVEHTAKHARKKDALDKLFKVKKAKRKVADSIYEELLKVNKDFKILNSTIKASKERLSELFTHKKSTNEQMEKRAFQEEINLLQLTRKELFATKDLLQENRKRLKASLSLANDETKMVQHEINKVLNQ